MLKKFIRYIVPVPLKKGLKYSYYSFRDFSDVVLGRRNPLYPPRRLNFVGSANFIAVGDEFLRHLQNLSGVRNDERILDIGCGIGRIAIPLTKYLSSRGSYEGFDIDLRGIHWCERHLTPRFPNFHFQHANIYNKFYNRHGNIAAKDFRFPYPDASFDFAFAASVFTHMLENDITQYLSELRRVLKPEGHYLITFFLLNDAVRARMQRGKTTANFAYQDPSSPHAFFSHKSVPEAEIASEESWVRNMLREHQLDAELRLYPGWWSGEKGTSYQDILIGKVRSR